MSPKCSLLLHYSLSPLELQFKCLFACFSKSLPNFVEEGIQKSLWPFLCPSLNFVFNSLYTHKSLIQGPYCLSLPLLLLLPFPDSHSSQTLYSWYNILAMPFTLTQSPCFGVCMGFAKSWKQLK